MVNTDYREIMGLCRPYYRVPKPENDVLYAKYKQLRTQRRTCTFVGRLATYKYYNMDQVVAQALTLYKRIIEKPAHQVEAANERQAGKVAALGRR